MFASLLYIPAQCMLPTTASNTAVFSPRRVRTNHPKVSISYSPQLPTSPMNGTGWCLEPKIRCLTWMTCCRIRFRYHVQCHCRWHVAIPVAVASAFAFIFGITVAVAVEFGQDLTRITFHFVIYGRLKFPNTKLLKKNIEANKDFLSLL